MKPKFGSILVDARGSVGAVTASKNHQGPFMRERVIPTYQNTTFQASARARLTSCVAAWQSLNDAQRKEWSKFADNVHNEKFHFVENCNSGYSAFISCNLNHLKIGLTILQIPGSLPLFRLFTFRLLYLRTTVPAYRVFGSTFINSAYQYVVWATLPLSPGISNADALYKYLGNADMANVSSVGFDGIYFNRFGLYLVPGDKIFVKLFVVHKLSGLSSLAVKCFGYAF